MKNWKTTVAGLVLSLLQFAPHFGHIGTMTIDQWLLAIGTFGAGLVAKDHNVTGGTVSQ